MTTSPDTRASLILRLKSTEDSAVWSEFVRLYQAVIYRTARQQGLCHDDAAEVSQEVLARVMKSIERWEPDPNRGTFRGWLYRITRNLSIDYLRQARRRPATGNGTTVFASVKQPGGNESSEFDLQLERQLFRKAAIQIKHDFADTTWNSFWRTAVLGESIEQVANELSLSRGAVYIARSRVMSRLKTTVQSLLSETTASEVES